MMDKMGLTKVMEECAELIQICAKKSAFMDVDIHPDGSHMPTRLTDEIGDVLGTISFAVTKLGLDWTAINKRTDERLKTLKRWDNLPD